MPLVTPAVAPFEYCLHVPHDPRAVRVARASLRTALTAHELPELVERAELLASEMLTNAIVHAGGEADLRVKWCAERLRMTVWDISATPPSRREIHGDSECGRGLQLLELLADSWSHFALSGELWSPASKVVWCEIGRTPPASWG
ncbi:MULTISPECIES: ATP-binding protein [unclassified Streptomyces]|uniref:ATP-binding protein n=1 Tax=unclassified Streptomyces TaxID=2593676 RepID=UPI00336A17AC